MVRSTSDPIFPPHTPSLGLKVILILSLCAALSACGGNRTIPNPNLTSTSVEVVVTVPYECGVAPASDPVRMRTINWDLMTVDGTALYTLTVDGYKLLGLNTSDWIAASAQIKAQRNHYRDCITRSQQEVSNEDVDSSLDSSFSTE